MASENRSALGGRPTLWSTIQQKRNDITQQYNETQASLRRQRESIEQQYHQMQQAKANLEKQMNDHRSNIIQKKEDVERQVQEKRDAVQRQKQEVERQFRLYQNLYRQKKRELERLFKLELTEVPEEEAKLDAATASATQDSSPSRSAASDAMFNHVQGQQSPTAASSPASRHSNHSNHTSHSHGHTDHTSANNQFSPTKTDHTSEGDDLPTTPPKMLRPQYVPMTTTSMGQFLSRRDDDTTSIVLLSDESTDELPVIMVRSSGSALQQSDNNLFPDLDNAAAPGEDNANGNDGIGNGYFSFFDLGTDQENQSKRDKTHKQARKVTPDRTGPKERQTSRFSPRHEEEEAQSDDTSDDYTKDYDKDSESEQDGVGGDEEEFYDYSRDKVSSDDDSTERHKSRRTRDKHRHKHRDRDRDRDRDRRQDRHKHRDKDRHHKDRSRHHHRDRDRNHRSHANVVQDYSSDEYTQEESTIHSPPKQKHQRHHEDESICSDVETDASSYYESDLATLRRVFQAGYKSIPRILRDDYTGVPRG